jgi:hypothetical protein
MKLRRSYAPHLWGFLAALVITAALVVALLEDTQGMSDQFGSSAPHIMVRASGGGVGTAPVTTRPRG